MAPPDRPEVSTPRRRTGFRLDWPSCPLVKAVAALKAARVAVPSPVTDAVDRVDELWVEQRDKLAEIRATQPPVNDLAAMLVAGELDGQSLHDQAVSREPTPIVETIRRTYHRALDQSCHEANARMWAAADDLFDELRSRADALLDGGTDEVMWERTWAALRALERGFLPGVRVPTAFGAADLYRRPDLAATWQVEELARAPGSGAEVIASEDHRGCRVLYVRPKAGRGWPDIRSVRVAAEHRDEWGASLWRADEIVETVNAWRARVRALAAGPR